MVRRRVILTVLCLVLLSNGCAVQKSQAPQIDPKTATALNLGENLKQLNADYRTFFKDVGDAQRRGQLSATQVDMLNNIGHGMKLALDNANKVFITYSQTYDQGAVAQIQGYLFDAAQIYATLITNRTQMLGGK